MAAGESGRRRGKLLTGCRVVFLHPEWDLSCEACGRWLVTAGGNLHRDAAGEPQERGPVPTPCDGCPKVPTWAKQAGLDVPDLRKLAADLSPANRKALTFYRAARAAGTVLTDPVSVWYAGLIGRAADEVAAVRADRTHESNRTVVTTLLEVLSVRRR